MPTLSKIISPSDLNKYFFDPLEDVIKKFGCSQEEFISTCAEVGIKRWPNNYFNRLQSLINSTELSKTLTNNQQKNLLDILYKGMEDLFDSVTEDPEQCMNDAIGRYNVAFLKSLDQNTYPSLVPIPSTQSLRIDSTYNSSINLSTLPRTNAPNSQYPFWRHDKKQTASTNIQPKNKSDISVYFNKPYDEVHKLMGSAFKATLKQCNIKKWPYLKFRTLYRIIKTVDSNDSYTIAEKSSLLNSLYEAYLDLKKHPNKSLSDYDFTTKRLNQIRQKYGNWSDNYIPIDWKPNVEPKIYFKDNVACHPNLLSLCNYGDYIFTELALYEVSDENQRYKTLKNITPFNIDEFYDQIISLGHEMKEDNVGNYMPVTRVQVMEAIISARQSVMMNSMN